MEDKGYIHIYTGNGKGKTTAAFGLALRAVFAGMKVYVGQFVKSMKYNETKLQSVCDSIEIEQLGRGCFINKDPEKIDIEMAEQGLQHCLEKMKSGKFDVIILDEITIAIYFNLLSVERVKDFLKQKPEKVELVITGRYAPDELIEMADLVTEMREVKHYYTQGVLSRNGIDR